VSSEPTGRPLDRDELGERCAQGVELVLNELSGTSTVGDADLELPSSRAARASPERRPSR
jgi:hypothetical protein